SEASTLWHCCHAARGRHTPDCALSLLRLLYTPRRRSSPPTLRTSESSCARRTTAAVRRGARPRAADHVPQETRDLIRIRHLTIAAIVAVVLCSGSTFAGAGGRAAATDDGPAGTVRARRWDGRRAGLARDERVLGMLSSAGRRALGGF